MSKKIIVAFEKGHSDTDPGAVSSKSGKRICERDETEKVGALVVENLRDRGIEVLTDAKDNKGFNFVGTANRKEGCALYVSLHFNAGGGDGAEAYVYNAKRRPLGDAFKRPMAAIGQQWRGTKLEPEFVVLRDTTMPAVLVEGYFVDSKDAKEWATTEGRKKMAKAVTEGIIGALESLGYTVSKAKPSKDRKPAGMTFHCYDVKRGDDTPFARACMVQLKYKGYYSYRINGDSVFGSAAVKALKNFQDKKSLPCTGEVDEITAKALFAE